MNYISIDPAFDALEVSDFIVRTYEICETIFKFEDTNLMVALLDAKDAGGFEALMQEHPTKKGQYMLGISEDYFLKEFNQRDLVCTIGHELVHLAQIAKGELDLGMVGDPVLFRGTIYNFQNTEEYWFAPWEIEARGYELAIWHMFTKD